jgi:trans-aconitate 2-methyltransferase
MHHQGKAAGTRWDPGVYLTFGDQRLRPALELLERIPLTSPASIVDLGCGTGQVTRMLGERWPSASVVGLDNSREMLARAAAEPGRVEWIEGDIAEWRPSEPVDLMYSNAALHWVDDHPTLFARLVGFLKPGGCLAIQMPLSFDLPSHRLMRDTLDAGGPGGSRLGSEDLRLSVARRWVADPETYFALLNALAGALDIWQTEYLQVLEGDDPVLAWVTGTGLRPILNGLDDRERPLFLAEYRKRLRQAYPPLTDGRTLYPFRRLFIVATSRG